MGQDSFQKRFMGRDETGKVYHHASPDFGRLDAPVPTDLISIKRAMPNVAIRKTMRGGPPPPRETLTEQAYRKLEEQIVTLRLRPGEFLSEQALSDGLGLGRTPTREALQRLAREGLVTILPRKGILVSDTDSRRQLLVLEVRRELERLLSRLAAQRADGRQRDLLRDIADGMDCAARTNDDIAFMRLDRDFNLLLAAAAHNEYATRAMRSLYGHSRRYWYLHYKEAADLPLCARLHASQARAVADGDPKRAAGAADRLIDYTETFTRATVGP